MGGLAKPIRRLPFKKALQVLRDAEATHKLSPAVSGLAINYWPDAKKEKGPINFLHTTAPRIAYANPTLPFLVSRIPMPFKPSKNAYKLNQDPNPPTTEEEIARMKAAESAVSTLTISFHTREPETFELTTLTGMQIWERLENLAGAGAQSQVAASSTPAVEAPKAAA